MTSFPGFFSIFNVEECIQQLEKNGGYTIPHFLDEKWRLMMLKELKQATFVQQPAEYGRYAVRQSFSSVELFAEGSLFLTMQKDLGRCLQRAFGKKSGVFSTPLEFTDLVVQRYPRGDAGISPHRDGESMINLIAVLVLEGEGRFCFCDDRAGTNPRPMRNKPRDLLLMRGPGFLGGNIQPFHFVDQITEERTTFGLRQEKQ